MFLFSHQTLSVPPQEEVVCVADFMSEQKLDVAIESCKQKLSEFSGSNTTVLQRFDHLADVLKIHYLETDAKFPFSMVLDAISFAAQKHVSQVRKDEDATPYIIHPMGVALSLWEEGAVRNPTVIIAALLHDTLEDTDATKEEIAMLFGCQVSEIVAELTNPSDLSSQEAKEWQIQHAPFLSQEAKLVKLSDRLYNVRDLRTPPVGWNEDKIQNYYEWGQKLLEALQGTHPAMEQLLQNEILANSPHKLLKKDPF
jgi:(p)ppGpp synthase/HD superfamily hydrolase